jgi:hypothetical protein
MEGGHTSGTADVIKNTVVLNPAEAHEECVVLKKGQSLVYKFSSSRPVDFNIHHHSEGQVQYPVSEKGITEYDGIFDPARGDFNLEKEEYFCLMWENPDMRQSRLSYECEVREK